jgi:hypothetical protein
VLVMECWVDVACVCVMIVTHRPATWGRGQQLLNIMRRNDLREGISKTQWTLREEYVLAVAHSQLGNQ